jgi:uncharacterized membrane protein
MLLRFQPPCRTVPIRLGAMLLIALVLTLGPATHVFGQCNYSVQQIIGPGCPPFGSPTPLIATGLNKNGEVVGHYADCSNENRHPFYWSEQTGLVTLPFPDGAVSARPYDINDMGQIVGEYRIPFVGWRGFMYDMLADEFHLLEPKFGVGMSVVNAINNAGIAVGARSITKAGNNPHNAVIWDTNTGKITDLGVMQGPNSWANSVNQLAQLAGTTGGTTPTIRGFVHDRQTVILPAIPDGINSLAFDLTDQLTVVGGGLVPIGGQSLARGAIWDGNWVVVIDAPDGFNQVAAWDVNNINQVLVQATDTSGSTAPFLWQNGEMYNLNDLASSGPLLTHAADISDAGQILVRVANTRGGLLTPIDVPVGDLNLDCHVDGHDLMILLESWGPVSRGAWGARGSNTNPNADLNGDGVVDGTDLLILLANWTF